MPARPTNAGATGKGDFKWKDGKDGKEAGCTLDFFEKSKKSESFTYTVTYQTHH